MGGQVGAVQVGAAQVGTGQVGAGQVGTVQVRHRKPGRQCTGRHRTGWQPGQVGTGQVGTGTGRHRTGHHHRGTVQVGTGQVGTGQVGTGQVGTGQVGTARSRHRTGWHRQVGTGQVGTVQGSAQDATAFSGVVTHRQHFDHVLTACVALKKHCAGRLSLISFSFQSIDLNRCRKRRLNLVVFPKALAVIALAGIHRLYRPTYRLLRCAQCDCLASG